ncbi:MAG TPA: ABC transporter permease [Steroidobacteraceae bacterium]|jgi:putative ABC transport system permease protein
MVRNSSAAAIRSLFHEGAFGALNVLGLALGFAAALLIGLYVRDEYSYDLFFPQHERIFKVDGELSFPGRPPITGSQVPSDVAQGLQLDFPQVEMTARVLRMPVTLKRGEREGSVQDAYWADPQFLRLFQMKQIAGDPARALNQPDEIVLTRKVAQRFFDRTDVVGETIELDGAHAMRVTAVVEDLPSNTHLTGDVFLPAVAKFSPISIEDAISWGPGRMKRFQIYTYARLRPGSDVSRINGAMPAFVKRHYSTTVFGVPLSEHYRLSLSPMAGAHLQPRQVDAMKPQADPQTLHALGGIAILILFIAGSNFVSLMTARSLRRAGEIAVRKTVGATRSQIAAQFMAECLVYVGVAMGIALLAASVVLPAFNAFLRRDIRLDLLHWTGAAAVIATLIVGLAASAYPALILSGFQPGTVLRGTAILAPGAGRLRRALVVVQFSILVTMTIVTLTVHGQTQYAIEERLRLPGNLIYMEFGSCSAAYRDAVRAVPGVRAASCTSSSSVAQSHWGANFLTPHGTSVGTESGQIDDAFFEVLGIKPVAGRLLSRERGEDDVLRDGDNIDKNPSVVLNESAVRALGFTSPQEAVGAQLRWSRPRMGPGGANVQTDPISSQIVGVVRDFSLGSVRDTIEATAYYLDAPISRFALVLQLTGDRLPETIQAVEDIWKRQGLPGLFAGQFLNQYLNALYSDIVRQARIFTAFCAVAVILAALGLLGMAAFTARRATREIGLRKVMGATRLDILGFLGWQFSRPILWANLVAWPLGYFFMQRWLEGFAYHVDLTIATFLMAGALAFGVAAITVAGHAFAIARTRPVEALRYE